MTKIPIKDLNEWFKNTNSGSIECANQTEYEKYMAALTYERNKENQVNSLQKEVSDLKSEIGELKSLLLTLVNKQD